MLALHKDMREACLLEAADRDRERGNVGERREGAGLVFLPSSA